METAMTALLARERGTQDRSRRALQAQHDERSQRSDVVQQVAHTRTDSRGRRVEQDSSPESRTSRTLPNDANALVASVRRLRGSVSRIAGGRFGRGCCEYLPLFAGASDVLDVGCGRGEFLRAAARSTA